MSHRLLNRSEEATYQRVWKVAEKNGAHVFPKVRLKDAIPVKNSGVSEADLSFAIMAHLDFLVTDAFFHPLFAVEFDGPTHETDMQQQRRDRHKDALMERFELPLLRINANYLHRKYRDFDLLSFFLELWFLRDSVFKALEAGFVPVPFDDPLFGGDFDPSVAMHQVCRKRCWPYWNSSETELIRDLFNKGQIASPCENHWIGQDDAARRRCIMWILLPGGGCCFVETGMRRQQFPVVQDRILGQAAFFDLFEQIQSVIAGERAARTNVELEETLDYYASHFGRAGGGQWGGHPYGRPGWPRRLVKRQRPSHGHGKDRTV